MNPKPKGIPGSYFVGLDIFSEPLTVVDDKRDGFQGGFPITFEIVDNVILSENQPLNIRCEYVILLNGELRLGEGHYYLSERAEQVLNAGTMGIENGKIIHLDNWSGHYQPDKVDVINAKNFFEQNQLTDDIFVTFIPFK